MANNIEIKPRKMKFDSDHKLQFDFSRYSKRIGKTLQTSLRARRKGKIAKGFVPVQSIDSKLTILYNLLDN